MGTRWTPLAALIAVAAAVLAAAGVVAVAAHEDDDDRPAVEALGDPEVTTTITLPPTTTSILDAPAPTTTSPPTTVGRTTTTRGGATSTTRRTTTTRAPATPTTSTPPLCLADQIDISGRPDRLSYPAGQPVTVSATIRNRSSAPCYYRGYTVEIRFLDPAGQQIIGQVAHADDLDFQTFAPGQSITHTATWEPLRHCTPPPCAPPRPDIYSIQAIWSFSGGRYTATQQYVLTP